MILELSVSWWIQCTCAIAELLKLCVHCARRQSTAGSRCHNVDGVSVKWLLSRRMCDASTVHDHVVFHDVCDRWHTDAIAHGHHQVCQPLSIWFTVTTDLYIYSIAGCVTGQSRNSESCYDSQGAIIGVKSMYMFSVDVPLQNIMCQNI